jgi:hypothetical protein
MNATQWTFRSPVGFKNTQQMSDAHLFHAHVRVDVLITKRIIVFESQPFNHQVETDGGYIAITAKISFDQRYYISMRP